jgi:hypothetical protein
MAGEAVRPNMTKSPAAYLGGGFPRRISNLRVLPPGLLTVECLPSLCLKHPCLATVRYFASMLGCGSAAVLGGGAVGPLRDNF